MGRYHYLSSFFAGVFLTNFVPHFVKGVCGDAFPTPFAKPPGQGLSSPSLNILWALFNLVVGYVLFRAGRVYTENDLSKLIFFAGLALMSSYLAKRFVTKDKL
ncbi:hypothetical protein [Pedobacter westerhofensis]|uniref:hypothetical protein n=1 Tax=Pedobacter westerhofensis TaxID=425512 RepID=UPI00115AB867|nr:hypothetical protein [Pedobacter westerhofensis]